MDIEIIVMDESYIWLGCLREGGSSFSLSKLSHQQHFLFGHNPIALAEFFEKINEAEVRKIDMASQISPYTEFGDFHLLFINLN